MGKWVAPGVNESIRMVSLVQLCPPTPAATETGNAGISTMKSEVKDSWGGSPQATEVRWC